MLLQLRCSNGSTQVGMCAGGLLLCQTGPDWAGPDWAELRRLCQNRADLLCLFFVFFSFIKHTQECTQTSGNLSLHAPRPTHLYAHYYA